MSDLVICWSDLSVSVVAVCSVFQLVLDDFDAWQVVLDSFLPAAVCAGALGQQCTPVICGMFPLKINAFDIVFLSGRPLHQFGLPWHVAFTALNTSWPKVTITLAVAISLTSLALCRLLFAFLGFHFHFQAHDLSNIADFWIICLLSLLL